MNLGIVGHAADKFDTRTRLLACDAIMGLIAVKEATCVVSGRSPMGGVDVWAEALALYMGVETLIHPPTVNRWDAPGGFRDRNLAIARDSDLVVVVVVRHLPEGYTGRRFDGCYHCKGRVPEHVKSGGCWTAWKAKAREWVILE